MPLIFSNPFDGRLTVGNVVANFRITDSGELAFPMGSRSRAMGLVEALEAQLNGGPHNGPVGALPAPVTVVDAATSKPEEKHVEPTSMAAPAAKRPRGRPPKSRGAVEVVTAPESQPKKHAGKRRAE